MTDEPSIVPDKPPIVIQLRGAGSAVSFGMGRVTVVTKTPWRIHARRILGSPWTRLVVKEAWDWAREQWLQARVSRRRLRDA